MDTAAMHEAIQGSAAGRLTFPQVVGMLMNAGVESYFVDFARGTDTFYLADGGTHVEVFTPGTTPIPEDLNTAEVVGAIRAAQADTIRYPEFVERARKAGVTAYWAFLTGRKVVYFGRKGELHIEEFPRQS